jgi:hypothetical protein
MQLSIVQPKSVRRTPEDVRRIMTRRLETEILDDQAVEEVLDTNGIDDADERERYRRKFKDSKAARNNNGGKRERKKL